MGRKTDGEKIDELKDLVARLDERLTAIRQAIGGLDEEHRSMRDALADLTTQLTVLRRDMDAVKDDLAESSKRRWSLLPPVLGAIVSVLLAALISYLVARPH